jgi:hypothetical protein
MHPANSNGDAVMATDNILASARVMKASFVDLRENCRS